jgi:hypothetical protein
VPVSISWSIVPSACASDRWSATPWDCRLWGHVTRGSTRRVAATEHGREPEIEHLHLAVTTQEHVRRLQAAVNDAVLVSVRKTSTNFDADTQRVAHGQRAAPRSRRERLAPEQLHYEVRPALAVPDVVQVDDVGMREARRGLGLGEYNAIVCRASRGGANGLERYVAIEFPIERLVDDSEAAAADLSSDLEPVHHVTNAEWRFPADGARRRASQLLEAARSSL